MAGDWIAVEYATPRKPEILAVAHRLQADPDIIFARWFKLWCWADENLPPSGHAIGVTFSHLDDIAGIPGISEAFSGEKWLRKTTKGVRFVNFAKRNGKPAKTRLLAAERKRREREQSREQRDEIVTTEQDTGHRKQKQNRKKKKDTPPTPPVGGHVDSGKSISEKPDDLEGIAHDILVERVPAGKGHFIEEAAIGQVKIRLESGEAGETIGAFIAAWGRGEISDRDDLAAAIRDRYAEWKREAGL